MNRTFILSMVGFFVTTMAVAYPWHMLLFHEQYVAMGAFTRIEPLMPFGMAAITLQAFVFAYFYPLFLAHHKRKSTIASGIKFSFLMGLTVYSVMVLATAAKFQIEPVSQFFIYGTLFQLIQFVAVGIVLGLLHRTKTG